MRYKGQVTRKKLQQQFPEWVDIQNPDGGWRRQFDVMLAWHAARKLEWSLGQGDQWHTRFCFLNAEMADAFHIEFGGERKSAEPEPVRGR